LNSNRAAVILAAGKGVRMKSDKAKVLHEVGGRPMICILVETLTSLDFDKIVVVIGHQGEQVKAALAQYHVKFAWQKEQLGTGHAVMMAEKELSGFEGITFVVAGDVPFLSATTIEKLFEVHRSRQSAATCLSAIFDDPAGYGRIVRDGDSDGLAAIIEQKDADEATRQIKEVNSGAFCFDNQLLFEALGEVGNRNAQGEYYLTDTVKILTAKGLSVSVAVADDPDEVLGINSREQLEDLEAKFADRMR